MTCNNDCSKALLEQLDRARERYAHGQQLIQQARELWTMLQSGVLYPEQARKLVDELVLDVQAHRATAPRGRL